MPDELNNRSYHREQSGITLSTCFSGLRPLAVAINPRVAPEKPQVRSHEFVQAVLTSQDVFVEHHQEN